MNLERIKELLNKWKFPLLILALGLVLLLIPGSPEGIQTPDSDALQLERALSEAKGVGEITVIVSDHGVVIVCDGADNAEIRLDILHAIGSYTGYRSDQITILKRVSS